MAQDISLLRDEAELLIDLLEENYCTVKYPVHAGIGLDLATQLRELFGMSKRDEEIDENLI